MYGSMYNNCFIMGHEKYTRFVQINSISIIFNLTKGNCHLSYSWKLYFFLYVPTVEKFQESIYLCYVKLFIFIQVNLLIFTNFLIINTC